MSKLKGIDGEITRQSIFTRVVTHLLTQKSPAADDGQCFYRCDDGKQCAVGCLIPDALYSDTFEYKGISGLCRVLKESSDTQEIELGNTLEENGELLLTLQALHDTVSAVSWQARLSGLAVSLNLEMPFDYKEKT